MQRHNPLLTIASNRIVSRHVAQNLNPYFKQNEVPPAVCVVRNSPKIQDR